MALLTPELVERAQRVNPYYQRRLGWPVLRPWRDVTSADFAYYVARYQRAANQGSLLIDGVLGPKTWAHMNKRSYKAPTVRHLVVGGNYMAVPFDVVTFEDPQGLSFYGQKGWCDRTDPTGKGVNLLVLHWDECLSSHDCFHVLLHRQLSVHLLLDADGTVYQTLDLAEARGYHAKAANERSIGIEVQNSLHPQTNATQRPERSSITEPRAHDGGDYTHLDFHTVQKKRVEQVVHALCTLFPSIPQRLPHADGAVLGGLAPAGFTGVCGHYHLQKEKVDPGMSLWSGLTALLPLDPATACVTPKVAAPAESPAEVALAVNTPDAPAGGVATATAALEASALAEPPSME